MIRSRRSVGQPSEPLEFFLDRSLGRRTTEQLRELGWSVRHLCEVYPNDGQDIADEEWIAYGIAQGWALLTQDERIRYRAHERGALDGGHTPMFYLTKKDLVVADKVKRFHTHQAQIYRAVRLGEAAIYAVYEDRIDKKWP